MLIPKHAVNFRQRVPVIVLGPYMSGTNFLRRSLEDTGVVVYNSPGRRHWNLTGMPFHKHAIIEERTLSILTPPLNALFACLIKDPFFWMQSLKSNVLEAVEAPEMSRMQRAGLSEFIRAPGSIVGPLNDRTDKDAFVAYANLPDLWNRYVGGYVRYLPENNTMLLRYEDALQIPQRTLQPVLQRLGLEGTAVNLYRGRKFQTRQERGMGRNYGESLGYYSNLDRRGEGFSEEDSEFVWRHLDQELVKQMSVPAPSVANQTVPAGP